MQKIFEDMKALLEECQIEQEKSEVFLRAFSASNGEDAVAIFQIFEKDPAMAGKIVENFIEKKKALESGDLESLKKIILAEGDFLSQIS